MTLNSRFRSSLGQWKIWIWLKKGNFTVFWRCCAYAGKGFLTCSYSNWSQPLQMRVIAGREDFPLGSG